MKLARPSSPLLRSAIAALLAAALCAAAPAQESAPLGAVEWGPWQALLPFDHPDGGANIAAPTPLEDELRKLLAGGPGPDLERRFQGKGGLSISWMELGPSAFKGPLAEFAPLDLAALVPAGAPPRSAENAVAYLYRRIRTEAPTSLAIACGSDDGMRMWLNGRLILEADRPRALEPFEDRATLELARGDNHLLVKVDQAGGGWRFRLVAGSEPPVLAEVGGAQERVNSSIDRGMEYLLATQQRDGSWGFKAGEFPSGQTGLSLYALLKSGLPPSHSAIQRGLAYLKAHSPSRTYAIGCTLLALSALGGDEHREWREDLVSELLTAQQGTFGYPGDARDLSNTQYAALGLWAAAKEGHEVPARNWRDLLLHTLRYQAKDGGFAYQVAGAPSGSMTAAGLSVLSIALDQLSDGGAKPAESQAAAEAALARGFDWLERHFAVSFNPVATGAPELRWNHYFLYGVERACALRGIERLGAIDWYWEGAARLLETQGSLGEWSSAYGEAEPNTCFALLFLTRATASYASTGPSAGSQPRRSKGEKTYSTDDAQADVWLRASGDSPMILWIAGFSARARETYGWSDGPAKGLRIQRVEYLIDGQPAAAVEGAPERGWKQERFPVKQRFPASGSHTVAVRVHLLDPLADPASRPPPTVALESPAVQVSIEKLVDDWMLEYAQDDLRNLVRPLETTARASSSLHANPAGNAADFLQSTAWVCKPDDPFEVPWLVLEFHKPVRATHILISHANGTKMGQGDYDRAEVVEVRVNKLELPIVVTLAPDELRKTLVQLPKTGVLRQIELRVAQRTPGKKHKGSVGFAEIELQHRR